MSHNVDVMALDDADLDHLLNDCAAEVNRRRILAQAEWKAQQIQDQYAAAIGRHDGDPWVQPLGAHDSYRKDAIVTDADKTWKSNLDNNVWRPPTNWTEVVEQGSYPAWVQPTGATDAYSFDDRVTYNGFIWRSTNPGERTNVWEPGVYGWEQEGPAPG